MRILLPRATMSWLMQRPQVVVAEVVRQQRQPQLRPQTTKQRQTMMTILPMAPHREEVVAHQAEVQAVVQRVAHQPAVQQVEPEMVPELPKHNPHPMIVGIMTPMIAVGTGGPPELRKTKDTNTCANGVNWRNFKTDKKAYVQGETVNYEFEIDVKEWNPTLCGTSWGTWKQCWQSPDTDGSMGKNDADAEWGVTFFDHTGQEMHRLRTSGANSKNSYEKGEYLKIEGSFVIPNSQAAIGEWKANVFAMIPSYSNNLGISCGTLKAEENNIRIFYCYAKECKDGASAETQTLGAENNANLWMSSFANQTFMAFQ